MSAGPYVVKEWIPNSNRALLEENPNYVNGPMAIKQIEIVYVADLTSRVLQLSQGTLDYVNDLPAGTATDYPRCGQDVRGADRRHDDDCRQRRQAERHTARQP